MTEQTKTTTTRRKKEEKKERRRRRSATEKHPNETSNVSDQQQYRQYIGWTCSIIKRQRRIFALILFRVSLFLSLLLSVMCFFFFFFFFLSLFNSMSFLDWLSIMLFVWCCSGFSHYRRRPTPSLPQNVFGLLYFVMRFMCIRYTYFCLSYFTFDDTFHALFSLYSSLFRSCQCFAHEKPFLYGCSIPIWFFMGFVVLLWA